MRRNTFSAKLPYRIQARRRVPILDGNIWRLFRFCEAILNREGKFKIICYPEQLPFLRKYIGNPARFSTVTMENVEQVLKIKEKCLI